MKNLRSWLSREFGPLKPQKQEASSASEAGPTSAKPPLPESERPIETAHIAADFDPGEWNRTAPQPVEAPKNLEVHVSLEDLHPGDQRAYTAIAQAARKSALEFFNSFSPLSRTSDVPDLGLWFVQNFSVTAPRFIEDCCRDQARIIRRCALSPETRRMAQSALEAQIRAETCERLDDLLRDFSRALQPFTVEMGCFSDDVRAHESNEGLTMAGIAAGQLARCPSTSPHSTALLAQATAAELGSAGRRALRDSARQTWKRMNALALPKIVEFFKEVEKQPARLLDYCSRNCFGDNMSLQHQRAALASIQKELAFYADSAIRRFQIPLEIEQEDERIAQAQKRAEAEEFERALPAVRRSLRRAGVWSYVFGFLVLTPSVLMIAANPQILVGYAGLVLALFIILGFGCFWFGNQLRSGRFGIDKEGWAYKSGLIDFFGPAFKSPASGSQGEALANEASQSTKGSATRNVLTKKCAWCGRKYPADTTVCPLDGQPLESA